MAKIKCPVCGSDNTVVIYFPWVKVPTKLIDSTDDLSSKKILNSSDVEIDADMSIKTSIKCMDCDKYIDEEVNLGEFSLEEIKDHLIEKLDNMNEMNIKLTSKKGYEYYRMDVSQELNYIEYTTQQLIETSIEQLDDLQNINAQMVSQQFDESVHK